MMSAAPAQPGDTFQASLTVPYFQIFSVQTDHHPFPDKAAVNRVNIVFDPNGTAWPHPNLKLCTRFQPPRRKTAKYRLFLPETFLSTCIELDKKLPKE